MLCKKWQCPIIHTTFVSFDLCAVPVVISVHVDDTPLNLNDMMNYVGAVNLTLFKDLLGCRKRYSHDHRNMNLLPSDTLELRKSVSRDLHYAISQLLRYQGKEAYQNMKMEFSFNVLCEDSRDQDGPELWFP